MTAAAAARSPAVEEHITRQRKLLESLAERRLDALIVSALANIRYLTGFTGSSGMLLVSPEVVMLFTDPRYASQAAEQAACRVRVVRRLPESGLPALLVRRGWRNVGFEPARMTYQAFEKLRAEVPDRIRLVPAPGMVEELRMVKSASEIVRIRRSAETAEKAFARVMRRLRPGLAELEVAAELDYQMRRLGAEGPAFETIVASGERTAWPHADASGRRLKADEPVLVDMGAEREGYASDLTRMAVLGLPSRRFLSLYRAVLEAQLAALDAVAEGVGVDEVDRAARAVLRRHGLERYFLHSTGHGLGLEIHEAPRLAARERVKLRAGMVITIEPGVYLAGVGGVRIEDTVVVTPGGAEVLTNSSKELLVI